MNNNSGDVPLQGQGQREDSINLSSLMPDGYRLHDNEQPSQGANVRNASAGLNQNRPPSHQDSRSIHPLEQTKQTSSSTLFDLDVSKGVTIRLAAAGPPMVEQLQRGPPPIPERRLSGGGRPGIPPRQGSSRPIPFKQSSMGDVTACEAPSRGYPENLAFSTMTVNSEVTFQELSMRPGQQPPSQEEFVEEPVDGPQGDPNMPSFPASGDYKFKSRKSYVANTTVSPNRPSAALEFPPLYFLSRRFPLLLESVQKFFRFRWKVSYPLQRRIPLSRTLRKMNIFLTWGELLILIPFFLCIIAGTAYTFVYPSVGVTGQTARTPLIFAFATAVHNSFITLLLGMPFERAVWYHKFAARIAYVNGLLHTYVAFYHPSMIGVETVSQNLSFLGATPNLPMFMFADQINSAGTLMVMFMTTIVITALPWFRRKMFEVFYYIHIGCAIGVTCGAFFHTGILVPVLVGLTWGVDLFIRRIVMATCRYPKQANIRIISDSVVEVCFPKTDGFDYNPGQYIFLSVPEISLFEWHPFSVSSSPLQSVVTLHIRKAGTWTTALYELAQKKQQVSILFEGPYGSVAVDLMSNRYKMVILFSGGIGVTPMQAICNHLMYEQNTKQRKLKKLSFVWVERDPVVMDKVDVVRRTSTVLLSTPPGIDEYDTVSVLSQMESGRPQDIASTLLALVPASRISDEQLEVEYPEHEFEDLDILDEDNVSIMDVFSRRGSMSRRDSMSRRGSKLSVGSDGFVEPPDDVSMDETFLREAYANDDSTTAPQQALDLQVYLTSKNAPPGVASFPFVHLGRPNVKEIFAQMREEAIAMRESRVAVCVCAPKRLVNLCQKACAKYSDSRVAFDFHYEVFD